jgi:hypothetical protein
MSSSRSSRSPKTSTTPKGASSSQKKFVKQDSELEDKMFFYNYLVGVQKSRGLFEKENQKIVDKDQPIYHFIQHEKTAIECIQFHGN